MATWADVGHRLRWAVSVVALVVLSGGTPPLAAQDIAIPVEIHLPLLMKILNFDRNLPVKVQKQVTIGVLYQGRYRTSANVADEVRSMLTRMPEDVVGGFSIQVVSIDLDQVEDLGATLARQRLHVLYVAPLRAVDLQAVTRASRAAHVLTCTGVPQYVETGLAVGIDRRGERPQIVVNVEASRMEGADFTAQLLKLARIVKE